MSKWDKYGEKFLELRMKGMSYRRIAEEIAVSVTTLKAWGVKWNSEIKALAASRFGVFVDEYLIDIRSRLELRGQQIERLRDELEKRDLSDIETGELLRLFIRYVESAQKDAAPLRVEINSTMENYERILLKVAEVEVEDPRLPSPVEPETGKK